MADEPETETPSQIEPIELPPENPEPEPFVPEPIIYRALFDEDGLNARFFPSDVWPSGYPEGTVVITHDQWQEFLQHQGQRRWDGERVVPYEPPAPPLPPIVLSAEVLFFERMTDAEYDALDDSVRSGESARVYRGWAAATSFTEGTDLWALLIKHLDEIGATSPRRAELLARP